MNAEKLPIIVTKRGFYMVDCPETGKRESEKRCASCQYNRIMEATFVKCNYKNMKK